MNWFYQLVYLKLISSFHSKNWIDLNFQSLLEIFDSLFIVKSMVRFSFDIFRRQEEKVVLIFPDIFLFYKSISYFSIFVLNSISLDILTITETQLLTSHAFQLPEFCLCTTISRLSNSDPTIHFESARWVCRLILASFFTYTNHTTFNCFINSWSFRIYFPNELHDLKLFRLLLIVK